MVAFDQLAKFFAQGATLMTHPQTPDVHIPLSPAQLQRLRNFNNNVSVVTAIRDNAFALLLESQVTPPDLASWTFEITDSELIARPPIAPIIPTLVP